MNRDKKELGLAIFISIIISILLALLFRSRAYDDPFITYRYADNLRHGLGFVYNPSERVQSTTTPLFALLLAFLSPLWGDLPHLANLIGALSLAAGGLLLWELAAFWKAPWAGWTGLLLYPMFPLAITPLGSETPLYIAICLGAFVAYFHKRYNWSAVCAALAVLIRPDGLLVGIILGADFTIRYLKDKGQNPSSVTGFVSIPWEAILVFSILLLPWFGFAWAYFGSPFPVTLVAKQQQGAMAVSQRFAEGFLTTVGWYRSWRYELEAILALFGFVYVIRRAHGWLLFLAWPILYFASFSILGVSRYFWYYTPLVPGFLVCAGLGLQAISVWRPHMLPRWHLKYPLKMDRWTAFYPRSMQILSMILLIILGLAQVHGLPRLRSPDQRYAIYRAAGEWLAAHTDQDATVGALEVGIIGYYARRSMVDFAGLIQPQVAAQLTGGIDYNYAARWAVETFHPQYIVLFSGDFPQLEQEVVAPHCRLAMTFPGPTFRYEKDLLIYDCH
jgi:hypothetical protein